MEINLPNEVNLKSVFAIRKYVVIPAVSVVVILLLTVFVFVPQVRSIIELRSGLVSSQKELDKLEEKVQALSSLDEDTLIKQVETLETVLPTKKAVIEWLHALNGLSGESQVALGEIVLNPGSIATESAEASTSSKTRPTPTPKPTSSSRDRVVSAQLESFELGLEIEGSIDGVTHFLENIQQVAPVVRITALELVPVARRRGGVVPEEQLRGEIAQAKMELLLFYVPLPNQLAPVSKALDIISASEFELLERFEEFQVYEPSTRSSEIIGREDFFAPF